MDTVKYSRKPLVVDAVQITEENILEVGKWCKGKVLHDEQGKIALEVRVIHPADKKPQLAYAGDWVLKSKKGFKIYANDAFKKGFEQVDTVIDDIGDALRTNLVFQHDSA